MFCYHTKKNGAKFNLPPPHPFSGTVYIYCYNKSTPHIDYYYCGIVCSGSGSKVLEHYSCCTNIIFAKGVTPLCAIKTNNSTCKHTNNKIPGEKNGTLSQSHCNLAQHNGIELLYIGAHLIDRRRIRVNYE